MRNPLKCFALAFVVVVASTAPVKAGAISTVSARISYPAAGIRVISGTGNIFLGYGESFVKFEMLVWRLDGTTAVVPASRSGNTWGGSYTWTSGNSGTNAARAVKGRLTYRDRFGVLRTYTESAWQYP